MNALRARLTYANVTATVALFLALGGATAFAATQLAKNSVGTKQLKKNAVTGVKVKDGTLSGADIGGPVNSAKQATAAGTAQHADDADRLGGQTAASFQAAGSVQRIDWSVSGCPVGCTAPLIKVNDFVLSGFCSNLLGGEAAVIASGPAGTTLWQFGKFSSSAPFSEEIALTPSPFAVLAFGGATENFQGQMIVRSATHTLSLDLVVWQNNAGSCKVAGNALST